MKPSQLTVVFSNIDPSTTVLVLEEMSLTAADQAFFLPLLLCPPSGPGFHVGDWDPSLAHPWRKSIMRAVWGRVPFLPSDQLASVMTTKKSKEVENAKEKTLLFLPLPETALKRPPPTPPSCLIFLKPGSGTASFLYKILTKLKSQWPQAPWCGVVVCGVSSIELAAVEFDRLKREMAGILDSGLRLDFLTHAAPTEEKLHAARYPSRLSLVDSFPNDAFHGQMKRLAKGLLSFCEAAPEGDIEGLLAWATEL